MATGRTTSRASSSFGRAKVVEDEKETLRMTRLIGLKYYPTVKEVDAILERTRGRVQGVRVDVEKMTGKLVHESNFSQRKIYAG